MSRCRPSRCRRNLAQVRGVGRWAAGAGEGLITEDAEAIERARDGDLDAFEILVARYSMSAYRAATFFGAGDDAEDMVQDAFVKAFRKLRWFREGSPFRPWLLTIVVNQTKNLHRSRQRRDGLVLRLTDEPHAGPQSHGTDDPEDKALADERHAALRDAVRALPDKDRMVVTCRYFLELSEAETAEALGWPRGSVKSRTSRALDRLRSHLTAGVEVSDG